MVLNKIILEGEIVVISEFLSVVNVFALHIVQFQPLAFSPWLLELRFIHSN